MFRKFALFVLLVVSYTITMAQPITVDTIPPYKKDPNIPPFKITLLNNSVFTREQLPKNAYTVIIYFSPDCSHCKHEVKEIIKNMDKLAKVSFVWVSYKQMPEISEFIKFYSMERYPNMYVGRDPEYKVPSFYRVKFTPFVAVYDKKGQLMNVFEGGVEMPELLTLLMLK